MNKKLLLIAILAVSLSACKDDEEDTPIEAGPEEVVVSGFYNNVNKTTPEFTTIATRSDRVIEPQDLDFHPTRENELWVINKGTDNTGGSTVTISDAGLSNQSSIWLRDGNAWHFMALPSAISFSTTNENFGTSGNIQDANRRGGSFAGPSLWSSDMEVYAQDPGLDGEGNPLNGSHLDMLHGSPFALGMHSDQENAFWVFDSYNGHIAWYDFAADHGPGYHDHSDGIIRRYVEMPLTRDESGIPSHIVVDEPTATLFVCDPANSRILWMNTETASIDRSVPLVNELLAKHENMKDLEWGVFTDVNLDKPCGIEVIGNILYVSDYATGEIVAYDKESKVELARIETPAEGIMGIKADTKGQLWYVDAEADAVVRIDQQD